MSGKYRYLLVFWGGLFFASALILFISLQSLREESGSLLPPFPIVPSNGMETESGKPIDKPDGDVTEEDGSSQWSLLLATVSAIVSAAGFIATTYFALRNDRRQSALTKLEVEKLANEIERQRLEIEQLRRSQEEQKKSQ